MIWFIQHAMKALYPRTESLPGIEDTDPSTFLVRYRRESTGLMWLGLILGSFVFIWSPIVTLYLPVPSFFLPRSLLDKHAHRACGSGIYLLRQAIFLVKLAAGLCWGAHKSVRTKLGMEPYPPDPETWRTE